MKNFYVFFLLIFLCNCTIAQSTYKENCKRSHISNSTQRVNYFQYPTMNKYDIKYLKLDIAAEANNYFISGSCYTVSKAVSNVDSFVTELKSNMTVDSIFVDGVKKTFSQLNDHVIVKLTPSIPANSFFSVLIFYKGTTISNSGVYAGTASNNTLSYTATLSESYQAREWFPIKQILSDKIDSTDIWVTTSNTNKVGSNGNLLGIDNLANNKVRYRWHSNHPMNYYMPSIAVGNYQEYKNYAKPAAISPDSILILHYIPNSQSFLSSNKTNLDKTPAFVEKLSELYGLYPFYDEKYGHSTAEIGGGMEHQTMTTMCSTCYGESIVAHELGHQWFGDHVTCAKWNDIWLNEGFASYSEYLMAEKLPNLFSTTAAASMLNVHSNVMRSSTGSVYIPDASVYDENRIFSSQLSYDKGSAIIHTLRFEMQNDSLFFKTLKNFQTQFKDSVATGEDFKNVAEATCNRSFADFFTQWYYGQGYPTYNVTYYKSTANTLLLSVSESVSASNFTSFFKGLLELKITSNQGDTTVLINLNSNNQIFQFNYNKTPTGIVIDPNNWIINKNGTISNSIILPVKIVAFTGSSSNCNYLLNWTTTNELSIRKYEIQFSQDGINYNTIGTQNALKDSENNYAFTYNEPNLANCLFRLKVIEENGNVFYSNAINIISNCNIAFEVSLYPNPILNNEIYLNIHSNHSGINQLYLYNSIGQVIKKENVEVKKGLNNPIKWNHLGHLSKGTYYIKIINEEGQQINQKLLKN